MDPPHAPASYTGLDRLLQEDLDCIDRAGLLRSLRPTDRAGKYVQRDGQSLLNLAGNDYLGLAGHPQLIDAAQRATAEFGNGATASRLVCGSLDIHAQAEHEVARLKHAPAAMLLATGYTANLAVLTALAGPGDLVLLDKLNHASLIDAAQASGAEVRRYPHLDWVNLERMLAKHAREHGEAVGEAANTEDFWDQVPDAAREAAGLGPRQDSKGSSGVSDAPQAHRRLRDGARAKKAKRFIVTDSVFSMDGDCADLPALCDLADRYNAVLIVDEAHGTGVLGETGGGLAEHQGVVHRVYRCGMGGVVVSTASKAMGGLGGLVTGSATVIEYLINQARPFIYSTGIPPAQAAAIAQAAGLIAVDQQLRPRLAALCERFATGLTGRGWPVRVGTSMLPLTPIFPLVVGTAQAALAMAERMQDAGVLAVAIRPPTVPPGTARVRVSLRADLTDQELDAALRAIGPAA